jgi:transcription antitermination factor NusG
MPLDAHATVPIVSPTAPANQPGCGGYGRRWIVVQSHPQAERWASTNLRRSGYTTFLPTFLARVRDRVTRTLTRHVERPLFPSYLFAAVAPPDPWQPILHLPGVRTVLETSYGKPALMPQGAVEALEAGQAARQLTQLDTRWRPGAACVARHGALCGMPGVVVSVDGSEARVSFLIFGALRDVLVPTHCLASRDET